MRKLLILSALCLLPAPAGATLFEVLGVLAYYDDELDITWAMNANINGVQNLPTQLAWLSTLTIDGIGGWRLPSMDVNGDGTIIVCSADTQANCLDNELGYHYWHNGIGNPNDTPFIGVITGHWSSTPYAPDPLNVSYTFNMDNGMNGTGGNVPDNFYAWAVHDGRVPEPATALLLGSGLGFLAWTRRRA